MKLALVHDYLNQFGGAERVVAAFHELYRDAPVYTSIYDQARLPEIFRQMDIQASFMQKIPLVFPFFKLFFSVYPLAFESFDLSGYDVILSSSSAYAKGVKKDRDQLHICYCHTPMRFVWRYDDYVKREAFPAWAKLVLPFLLDPVKGWDLANSKRVDYFIANSRTVAERIRQIYGRESVIINPPVETGLFQPSGVDGDHFLVLSRLNAYKRLDIVVDAFNRLDLPLKIIGDGPMMKQLQQAARPNIEFLGRQPDGVIAEQLARCRALIFPGEEDFGIVPLEAMATGRPVIAFRAGGALETVVDGKTGLFFDRQEPNAIVEAVNRFNFLCFDKQLIRAHALKFDKTVFEQKIGAFVKEKYEEKFRKG